MRIVTHAEMKNLEELAQKKYHFSEKLIIENASLVGAKSVLDKLGGDIHQAELIFLIGKGFNGASGLAMARQLTILGVQSRAFIFFPEQDCSKELKDQLQVAQSYGIRADFIEEVNVLESYFHQNSSPKIFIDAIFGTGVKLPLSQFLYDVINLVNSEKALTIALDMPTGVEGDSGQIMGNAINADLTLAVGLPKLGYYQAEGPRLVGEVIVISSGLPRQLIKENGDKFLLDYELKDELPFERNKFGDKKLFGHTLIIGGSHGLTGAIVMASTAALKAGAGLVTACTWEPQYQEFMARLIPEVMTGYIPLDQGKWGRLIQGLEKYDAIVVGPGLGRSLRARALVLEILNNFSGPVILDADAINVLNINDDAEVFRVRNAPTLMTPHYGEFARFTGIDFDEVQKSPYQHLQEVIERINCTVILKGPGTFIGFPNGQTFISYSPNDGMATGGVGDVLTGILGGLAGQIDHKKQRKNLFNIYESLNKTIFLGVLIHTLSGRVAREKEGERSMSATSLIEAFPEAFNIVDKILKGEGNG